MKEAQFYEKLPEGKVHCGLCRFRCLIADGNRGICGVRENREGTLYTLVYGRAVANRADPIEKKPLYHFQPGTTTYSIATYGCNFRCLHCQNYTISQAGIQGREIGGIELAPEEIVRRAVASGCSSISYTYTEPTIFYEYAYDTAVLAKAAGLKNVFVTNGYITPEALGRISPFLDAANIDLKGYSEKFYREVVHAMLSEVLACIADYKRLGIWIEITTLVIPNFNDSDTDLKGIARFISTEIGPETPWHVTAFYPTYKLLDQPPTPVETLRRARRIGLEAGLKYVYEGNIPGEGGEDTYCPGCGKVLIRRYGYQIRDNGIREGRCPSCKSTIHGIDLS